MYYFLSPFVTLEYKSILFDESQTANLDLFYELVQIKLVVMWLLVNPIGKMI